MENEIKKYFEGIFKIEINENENLVTKCKTTAFIIFYYIIKFSKENSLNFCRNVELTNISISEIARLFN